MTQSVRKATDDQIRSSLAGLPGWQRAGDAIEKVYSFKDYYQTMAFVNATAWVSHATNHHPDLAVGYNRCTVRYTTHDAGGVSDKDLDCARQIEALAAHATQSPDASAPHSR